jgi:hypothetical protein
VAAGRRAASKGLHGQSRGYGKSLRQLAKAPQGLPGRDDAPAEHDVNSHHEPRFTGGRRAGSESVRYCPVSRHEGPRGAAAEGGETREALDEQRAAYTRAKDRRAELEGKFVDRQEMLGAVFSWGRARWDAWLNWPAQVSAILAGECGGDAARLHAGLEREVRVHLEAESNETYLMIGEQPPEDREEDRQ